MTNRVIGALAAVVSAIVHLYLWFDGVKDQGTVGDLFVVNVIAGLVIAALLLRWHHWIPLILLAGFGASTLGAFLIAVNGELFGIHTGWSWYAWLAAASEVVAIVCGVWGLYREGAVSGGRVDQGHRSAQR
ncbi:hypothetical protein ncot_11985 [Nocardioides sp. JQ2195]|uniref:hypothetical protein n=1 Tax=Nocardioides sp. JQ2195 TaxID=2592334 RepID=UPI00143E2920|nr:hypothetical protein [Nocardioides sp. JQ2195]QIX27240.1 hypothetical protein ncot_11985 [Nocardioides sp. JQ2195]